MKTIGEAIREFKTRFPKSTPAEISAFVQGWTAHEIAIEVAKLLTLKSN